MNDDATNERLRRAFQGPGETFRGECSEDDLDRIWKAVAGELPVEERRRVVERVAEDPAWAEAWRVAQEMRRASGGAAAATPPKRRPLSRPAPWLAAAAVLVLAVGAALVVRFLPSDGDTVRNGGTYAVEPATESEQTLPRQAFVLRWNEGPAGTRYQVRVTTDTLQPVLTATDLMTAEVTVPAERFADLPAGTRILWQVAAALPSGETVESQTFVVRVR